MAWFDPRVYCSGEFIMVLQFPRSINSATPSARNEIGGLSIEFLDDAQQPMPQCVELKSDRPSSTAPHSTAPPTSVDANAELRSRVNNVLNGIAAFRQLQVDVTLGEVTVRGTVGSDLEKRLLFQQLKRRVSAKHWIDEVDVTTPKVTHPCWVVRTRDAWAERRSSFMTSHSLRWGTAVCVMALLLVLAPWAGRGHGLDTSPVTVRVLFEEQLAIGAFVTLHPIGESQLPSDVRPAGYVQPNGQVRFATFGIQDGVPVGDYLVTVRWNKLVKNGEEASPGPNILPERYLLPMTSGLRIEVKAGQSELPPLELKR